MSVRTIWVTSVPSGLSDRHPSRGTGLSSTLLDRRRRFRLASPREGVTLAAWDPAAEPGERYLKMSGYPVSPDSADPRATQDVEGGFTVIVAVTGGCGSVGSPTVHELLKQGYQVRCLDRVALEDRRCPFFRVDLTDFGQVVGALHGCDAVIHLGAIRSPVGWPPHVVYANNAVSHYNVLEAAATLGIKKVCTASSVNAIGLAYSRKPTFDYFPIDENHETRAEDCYSLSKWCGEQVADGIARHHGDMTLISFRYANVRSPTSYASWRDSGSDKRADDPSGLWGYGDNRDVARANRLAIEARWTGHEVFFLTAADTDCDTPSRDLAERHHPEVPIRGDLSGCKSFFDCAKAAKLLGWEPEHSWRES